MAPRSPARDRLDEFLANDPTPVTTALAGETCLRVLLDGGDVWIHAVDPRGDLAVRAIRSPGGELRISEASPDRVVAEAAEGVYRCEIAAEAGGLRFRTTFRPAHESAYPPLPRDLFPLDGDRVDDEGVVLAAQRGLNTGLLYGGRACGTFLYVQDFTALATWHEATGTTPDGVVGGDWPELGYASKTPENPLPAGAEITLSAVLVAWGDPIDASDGRAEAARFLELFDRIYRRLDLPETEFRDWPAMAERAASDLANSPLATREDGGYRYVSPYVGAEEPDSMVQLTVLLSLLDYDDWRGEASPLASELRRGIHRFYDPDVAIVRRYLSNVPDNKKADAVDSWYLYHPIANLGRLACRGDEGARALYLASLDRAIEIARRFDYRWPVEYDIRTLEITKAERQPGAPGQTDAGGLYAFVMIQAYELTEEARFLDEARAALRATADLSFDLVYQTNLTSWGLNACLRTFRATGDEFFRRQALVFLASFLHNCAAWESEIRLARHYRTFLGVTCLHDGPYFAPYECYESFLAFHEALVEHGDLLPDCARHLMAEWSRYAADRAIHFYPSELPETVLAYRVRNGTLSRDLAFPVEDLYADGQPAGQVGQEVYGCGAAWAYLTRTFVPVAGGWLRSEYPLRPDGDGWTVVGGDGKARIDRIGGPTYVVNGETRTGVSTVRPGDQIALLSG